MARKKLKIFHFEISSPAGNFGDDILFLATKETFETIFHDYIVEWINYPLRNHTTNSVIKKANECDLVLVGGGGLLLKDTAQNTYSGWQWACSLKHLEMIQKPLIVYAIGCNRFRGQEEFDEIFFEHINKTVEKAAFFSVRNNGSKKSLLRYGLPEKRIIVNPCPSIFYETKVNEQKQKKDKFRIGINLAGDRAHLRYQKKEFYAQMENAFKRLMKQDYSLYFFNHNWNPTSNCQDLINRVRGIGIFETDTMWNRNDIDKVVNLYNSMDVIIAMRSHAQLVPFGQKKKVISLISHDKIKWFLEDVHMEYTGIEVNVKNLGEELPSLVDDILADEEYYNKQKDALQKLRDMYMNNFTTIMRTIECKNQ